MKIVYDNSDDQLIEVKTSDNKVAWIKEACKEAIEQAKSNPDRDSPVAVVAALDALVAAQDELLKEVA